MGSRRAPLRFATLSFLPRLRRLPVRRIDRAEQRVRIRQLRKRLGQHKLFDVPDDGTSGENMGRRRGERQSMVAGPGLEPGTYGL